VNRKIEKLTCQFWKKIKDNLCKLTNLSKNDNKNQFIIKKHNLNNNKVQKKNKGRFSENLPRMSESKPGRMQKNKSS